MAILSTKTPAAIVSVSSSRSDRIIGDGLVEAIELLGHRIRRLHLNDAVDGIEHREIGIGDLDLDEMAPLIFGDLDIEFATLEMGARLPEGEGIILRSREALRKHYGDTVATNELDRRCAR
jgi:hypothetical protein